MHGLQFRFLLILISLWSVNALGIFDMDIMELAKQAVEMFEGLVRDTPNMVPSADQIFRQSKQVIAGYPFQWVSSSINQMCSSALAVQRIKSKITPKMELMQFQLRTKCKKYSFPLLKANEMWQSPEFDVQKKVVILATGWTTNVNKTDTITYLARAYNCRGDVNFVAVDAAHFVNTLYTWSAFNTDPIGELIANGLVKLIELVPLENIHLMGHSLGAHIVGAAGRYFNQKTGKLIKRITALDPAKPCFNEGEELSGLQRGDAEFVDVIHSNNGVLGKLDPLGDADFYPGGLSPLPAGCMSITCAHARAWEYFAETVYPGNEMNFMSTRCSSLSTLLAGKCKSKQHPMGYAVPYNLKGNYFLEINKVPPFGKNSTQENFKANEKCGLCTTAVRTLSRENIKVNRSLGMP